MKKVTEFIKRKVQELIPSERTRGLIYRLITAGSTVLAGYGYIDNNDVTVIISVVGAILGTGLATANTNISKEKTNERSEP